MKKQPEEPPKKHTVQQASFIHQNTSKLNQDYKIVKKLGSGAFSEVFLVQNRITNNFECVKIIERSSLSSFEDEDIMNEIKTLSEMDHPNIMKIKGYYQTANHLYIISEYLSGGELFDRIIECHNFSESQAAKLIEQILSAVSYLHKHNVIHRDLKPENIVFETKEKDSLIKIIDFGTSKKVSKNEKLHSRLGTAYYIAPEVLAQNYDAKCDVWSCGVILYVFLFGVPPFNGKTDDEIFEKIKKGIFKFPDSGQKVSDDAKKMIIKMLTKNPEQRPSADALLQESWFVKMREKHTDLEGNILAMKNLKNFQSKYEFQKAILLYFVNFFDIKQEKNRLYKVFKDMDKDGDGQINKEELKAAYARTGKGMNNDDEINEIFARIDVNSTGNIDFTEFLMATVNYKQDIHEKELRQIFNIIDKDKSGTLSKDEIAEFFNLTGEDRAGELKALMNEVDTNKDGMISVDEFFNIMNLFLKDKN
jgi:calcium-dependent protein kinase